MKSLALLLFLSISLCSFGQKVDRVKEPGITQVKNVIDTFSEDEFKPYQNDNEGMYDDFYYDHDMHDHYYHYEPRYFEIRSTIYNMEHDGWCLQEAIKPRKHKRNFFIASVCDGSPSQKFFLDENGYLHNQKHLDKCLKRSGRWLKIDNCDRYDVAAMKWIFASDGTIRYGHQALFAISIPEKYTRGSWLNKKTVSTLQLKKIINRSPMENEQWMFFHEEPKWDDEWDKTMTPTMSPTSYYYPHNNHNNYPSYAPVSQPHQQPTPMKPTKPDGKKFNIAFKNMGKENMYNGAFEKARSKFEKMIVGDLSDHPKISDSGSDQEHDWFAGTWPDQKVNTYIDDVLIGYEITDIDGPGNVLGFAGPLFIRLDDDTTGKNGGTFTTISGIMKFDREDFKTMSKGDIELIVLHEMAHVLGLGTLWSGFKCGTECVPRDYEPDTTTDKRKSNNEYLCDGAVQEYKHMMKEYNHMMDSSPTTPMDEKNDILMISPDDCSHWSEESFLQSHSSELMTPMFEENKYQPLSGVSLASLADLGYKVNMTAADPLRHGNYIGSEIVFQPMQLDRDRHLQSRWQMRRCHPKMTGVVRLRNKNEAQELL